MKFFLFLFSPVHTMAYFCLGIGGGGGSSKSSNDTLNTDKRNSVQTGNAISGDDATLTINTTDGGITSRALDSFDKGSALNGQGFTQLLTAASGMFDKSQGLIGQTQAAVADAYGQAQLTKQGSIDNKTLIALAAAAVVGLVIFKRGAA